MSVFQVRLIPPGASAVYANDASAVNGVSSQRTVELVGPNGVRRIHSDGETFTESNYFKKYCPLSEGGTMPEDEAYLTLVSDDNTVWDDFNTTAANKRTVVKHLTVDGGTTYTDAGNEIDIAGLYGGYASFLQIITNQDIRVEINGSHDSIIYLAAGTQTFNEGEIAANLLRFDNTDSGVVTAHVQVVMGIRLTSST